MPPKRKGPTLASRPSPDNPNATIVNDSQCRCAYGELVCMCAFYADWTCDWDSPQDTPSQLDRRRAAALRMRPLEHSGRRDPISARLGRWAA